MSGTSPLISVIIPAYNYAHFLPCAITSIFEQQGGVNTEIIVVDDGSTDNTASVATAYGARVRYIHQENQGLSAARNTGIRAAKGEYLVFLDADDMLTPQVLTSHLRTFAAQRELDISVCLCLQTVESPGQTTQFVLWPIRHTHLDLFLCNSNISPVHTFMLRTSVAHEVGFFDESLKACEDQDYWLRCAAAGKSFAPCPEGLVIYRRHEASMSQQIAKQHTFDAIMILKVGALLENAPLFPRAGKYLGLLAHAAGCLGGVLNIHETFKPLSEKLQSKALAAVHKAFSEHISARPTTDTYLLASELFFCCSIVLSARALQNLGINIPASALDDIQNIYPNLFALSHEALYEKQTSIFTSLQLQTLPSQSAIFAMLRPGKST